jgi:CRP-like cAMP-binding protein
MLLVTHEAKKQVFDPLEVILSQGDSVDYFFMIESGSVDIIVKKEGANEISLASLGSGQFFGEVELTQGGQSIASVRAAKGGARVALLPKDKFFELIDKSPLTRKNIQEVASMRKSEHDRRSSEP